MLLRKTIVELRLVTSLSGYPRSAYRKISLQCNWTERRGKYVYLCLPIPVAVQSKVWICDRSLAGIGFESLWGYGYPCECCVLSGRGLYDRLITHARVLSNVVCQHVMSKPLQWGSVGSPGLSSYENNIWCLMSRTEQNTCRKQEGNWHEHTNGEIFSQGNWSEADHANNT